MDVLVMVLKNNNNNKGSGGGGSDLLLRWRTCVVYITQILWNSSVAAAMCNMAGFILSMSLLQLETCDNTLTVSTCQDFQVFPLGQASCKWSLMLPRDLSISITIHMLTLHSQTLEK
jgi:hypothetical protein